MATLDSTKPMAVPTGLAAVSPITISPVTVPSAMSTAERCSDFADFPPERRTERLSALCGAPAYDTSAE